MSKFDNLLANIRKKQFISAQRKQQQIFWQNVFLGTSPFVLLFLLYSNRFILKELLTIINPLNPQKVSQDSEESIHEIISVSAVKVEKVNSYFVTREYSGIIESQKNSLLGIAQSGQVQDIYVEVGQQVKEGQIIAKLNSDLLFQEKNRLVFELTRQQYVLADLLSKPDLDEIDQINAQIEDQKQQIAFLEITEKRYQYLYREGAISLERLDISQSELKTAYSQLEVLKSQRTQIEQGTPVELINSQKALISSINAQISSIDIQIEQNTLKAPYDGIISEINLREGSFYSTLNPIPLAEIRTHQVEFRIGVTPDIIPYLRENPYQKILVNDEIINVVLSRVSPESNLKTKTVSVFFEPKTNDLKTELIANQLAILRTSKEINQTGYRVPITALNTDIYGNWQVSTLNLLPEYSDIYEIIQIPIRVLSISEDFVIISGSINDDTLIVADGLNKIVPRQIVKIN